MAMDHRRGAAVNFAALDMVGRGFLAGSAPASSAPDAPDGRLKILNVPAVGRVVAMDRATLRIAGTALSRPDGTWRIDGLARDVYYLVTGFDDRGRVNAAVQDWVMAATPAAE